MHQPLATPLTLDGLVNARDLGGLPLSGGGTTSSRVLLRSDNLQDLSRDAVRVLVDELGVRTVIDLRTGFEIASEGPGPLARERLVRIEHRSLYPETGGGTDLDAETVKPWGDGIGADLPGETPVVRAYLGYLARRPDSIAGSIRTIAHSDGAVLVHCAAGKDRTGVVVALALEAAGVERDAIVADYLATAPNIEAIMARLVASPTYAPELDGDDPQAHAPHVGTMERVLELVDELHGGPVAWLRAHGVGDGDLAALRARLAV